MLHRTNMATAETGHRSACQPEASPMEAGDRGGGIRKRFFAADAWASQSSFSATSLVTPPECIRHGNLVSHAANAAAYRIWSPPDELAPSEAPSFPGRVGAGKAD